jgi:threonine aldolase
VSESAAAPDAVVEPRADRIVDLRSDTVTRPTAGMRAAIATAVVGDDALGDDPTVQQLEQRVAQILGKPAAVFFPSGIMANQTAIMLHAPRGTEAVCEGTAHVFDWELGGAAANAGVQLRPVPTTDGVLTAELIERAIRPRSATLQLQTSLICVENTHNAAGGRVIPLDVLRDVHDLARSYGLTVHLDGARLWNASVASGTVEAAFAACADTIMVTLSKGLGCPIGSVLAGEADAMQRARVIRRRLGGAMRQAGILAAAGVYALEHHIERLHEDHARARALAAAAAANIDGLRVVTPETNIVMFDIVRTGVTAADVLSRLAAHGVLLTEFSPTRLRAVTHLDIDDDAVQRAGDALAEVMTSL